jgi:hypothetical protein
VNSRRVLDIVCGDALRLRSGARMRLRNIAASALALLEGCRWGTEPPPSDAESGGSGWLRIEYPSFPNEAVLTSRPRFSGTMFLGPQVSNPSVIDCMFPEIALDWTNETTGATGHGVAIGERHQNCSFLFGECGDKFWCENTWAATPVVAPGTNRIRIRADDGLDNWGSATREVTFDLMSAVPRLAIAEPTSRDNWTTSTLDVRLKGYAIDTVGLRWTNRAFDSSGDIPLSNDGSIGWEVIVFLYPGENAITVTATAPSGATASDSILVTSTSQ